MDIPRYQGRWVVSANLLNRILDSKDLTVLPPKQVGQGFPLHGGYGFRHTAPHGHTTVHPGHATVKGGSSFCKDQIIQVLGLIFIFLCQKWMTFGCQEQKEFFSIPYRQTVFPRRGESLINLIANARGGFIYIYIYISANNMCSPSARSTIGQR